MKHKISITIDEKALDLIQIALVDGRFRSRSHVIEYSLRQFLDNFEKGV